MLPFCAFNCNFLAAFRWTLKASEQLRGYWEAFGSLGGLPQRKVELLWGEMQSLLHAGAAFRRCLLLWHICDCFILCSSHAFCLWKHFPALTTLAAVTWSILSSFLLPGLLVHPGPSLATPQWMSTCTNHPLVSVSPERNLRSFPQLSSAWG